MFFSSQEKNQQKFPGRKFINISTESLPRVNDLLVKSFLRVNNLSIESFNLHIIFSIERLFFELEIETHKTLGDIYRPRV